jgi:hypothetical protein
MAGTGGASPGGGMMAITEHELELAEFDYLNKRSQRAEAINDFELAYEKLCALRKQFLLEKLSAGGDGEG